MRTIDTTESTAEEDANPFAAEWAWRSGAVSGFLATLAMGTVIALTDLAVMRTTIAGLYGAEGVLLAGWVAHLVHGTLFGVVFAAVLADPGLYRVERWLWKTALAGVVYALVLAVVGAGFVMPVWLGIAGASVDVSLPYVTGPSVAWHVVYGLVLGVTYAVVESA